jgi:arginine/lysine/ornithine decarboxylase
LPTPPNKVELLPARSKDEVPEGEPFLKDKPTKLPDSLNQAIKEHVAKTRSSFHTPGHKGRPSPYADLGKGADFLARDLSESVPNMDDLSSPDGVLQELENRAAKCFGAASSLISVNGASAGIVASLLMLGKRAPTILVPRNAHKSLISGLILSGLTPIWFEPIWEPAWGFWGPTTAKEIKQVLQSASLHQVAGVCIVSPTYAGAVSNIKSIAELVHGYGIPLIVDEAHGANLLITETDGMAAIKNGADIVIHSLHKTLSGLTQTGMLHISNNGLEQFHFTKAELRLSLNLVQSTSPSYLFLNSIDQLISSIETGDCLRELGQLRELGERMREKLSKFSSIEFYQPQSPTNFTHILLKVEERSPRQVSEFLNERGIYPEACLGSGVLFMLGLGSRISDIESLVFALQELVDAKASSLRNRPWLKTEFADVPARLRAQAANSTPRSPVNSSSFQASSNSRATLQVSADLKTAYYTGSASVPPADPKAAYPPGSAGFQPASKSATDRSNNYTTGSETAHPARVMQIMSPRQASFAPSQMVPKDQAVGLIAAECIAPCPPGWLITIPGALITSDVLKYEQIDSISIVNNNALPHTNSSSNLPGP